MKVFLINHTYQPEKLVAIAAKNCYSNTKIDELSDSLDDEATAKFVDMLTEIGHESPVEHVSFTFGIEDVSRSLLAQITRHRLASFSVRSQRYVRETTNNFVVPPEIEKDAAAKKIYLDILAQVFEKYEELTEILYNKYLQQLLVSGKNEKQSQSIAQKKAIEDARYVLPNASHTNIVMTMNARSLMNFFKLRCCNRAQWEIRALAEEMYKLCLAAAPRLFAKSGPACTYGPCSEGKMTCGSIKEVREKYERITHG